MDFKKLRPFKDFLFLAEAGVNHEGSIEEAIRMVEEASRSGANAIKFQAYNADQLAHPTYAKAYWDKGEEETESQHQLFSKYQSFSKSDWERIKNSCLRNKIEFWLSIFDVSLAKNLYKLCDGLKIASGDITFERLHDFVLSSNKPSIFSTGAASEKEIFYLNQKIKNKNSISLFCRLSYPTADSNAEFGMFSNLSKKYETLRGVSDHCKTGNGESVILAFNLGAILVEKHFTLTPDAKGNDHYHSITPDVLKSTLSSIKRMQNIYQIKSETIPTKSEMPALIGARRSLFFTRNLKKNHILQDQDIIELRPNIGIEANKIKNIIGKKLMKDVKADEIIKYKDLS